MNTEQVQRNAMINHNQQNGTQPRLLQSVDFFKTWSGVVRVTPECAAKALAFNTDNRRLRLDKVKLHVRTINEGRWRPDHPDPIIFGWNRVMLNGQHRCMAVVESGIDIISRVMCGADPELRRELDGQEPRRLEDRIQFHHDHVVNLRCSQIVNFAHQLTAYRHGSLSKFETYKPTVGEAERIFAAHKDGIIFASEMCRKKQKSIATNPVMWAFVAMYEKNPVMAFEFVKSVIHADGPIQPARILRDTLLRTGSGNGMAERVDTYLKCLSAIRATLEGRELKSLRAGGYDL